MKPTPRLKKNLRIAAPFLFALLLALAILPAAVLAQPPEPGFEGGEGPAGPGNDPSSPGGGPPSGPTSPTATRMPTAAATAPAGPPPTATAPAGPGTGGPPTATPTATSVANPVATSAPNTQPHPSAPFTPPAGCIVAHAATPGQVCPIGGGLQYYFIGADGSSSQGPWISPFGDLAAAASASVYSGANPLTGKSVQITYLAAENKIRISTFYPDTQYDTNKPYNFTVDSNYSVSHEAW